MNSEQAGRLEEEETLDSVEQEYRSLQWGCEEAQMTCRGQGWPAVDTDSLDRAPGSGDSPAHRAYAYSRLASSIRFLRIPMSADTMSSKACNSFWMRFSFMVSA